MHFLLVRHFLLALRIIYFLSPLIPTLFSFSQLSFCSVLVFYLFKIAFQRKMDNIIRFCPCVDKYGKGVPGEEDMGYSWNVHTTCSFWALVQRVYNYADWCWLCCKANFPQTTVNCYSFHSQQNWIMTAERGKSWFASSYTAASHC